MDRVILLHLKRRRVIIPGNEVAVHVQRRVEIVRTVGASDARYTVGIVGMALIEIAAVKKILEADVAGWNEWGQVVIEIPRNRSRAPAGAVVGPCSVLGRAGI